MGIFSTAILALSLAMDAFVVSISSGISLQKVKIRDVIKIAFTFGLFQAVMPLIGYFISGSFYGFMCHIDHWAAFVLLSFIGAKMIYESVKEFGVCRKGLNSIDNKTLITLSVATSIDALAAGVSLNFLCVSIMLPVLVIGSVTFIMCYFGVLFGKKLGCKFGSSMEIAGGVVLILIGSQILMKEFFPKFL